MKRLVVYLAVLQGLDVFTTMQGISAGAAEQNPVGVMFLGAGWAGLAVAKLLGTAAIAAIAGVLWRGTAINQAQALAGLRFACSFMLAVVSWNVWIGWLHAG